MGKQSWFEPQNIEQGMSNDEVAVAHDYCCPTLAFEVLGAR